VRKTPEGLILDPALGSRHHRDEEAGYECGLLESVGLGIRFATAFGYAGVARNHRQRVGEATKRQGLDRARDEQVEMRTSSEVGTVGERR
jgi:hypothetical protein